MASSPYSDLDRPPLHAEALTKALIVPGGLWRELRVVGETGSTNADVAAAARTGAGEGLIVVAEAQLAGRGRLGRTWTAPPRSGLTFSVLLRPPEVPSARLVWLPLLAGAAVAASVGRLAELELRLKWPNDVLTGGRKLAGILVERADDAVVVGIGLNVTTRAAELPVPTATSLALAGAASTDRDPLLRAILREFGRQYLNWCEAHGDAAASGLAARYQDQCDTIGREVRVELPGGEAVAGTATGVDEFGRLVLQTAAGARSVGAGDVVHVR